MADTKISALTDIGTVATADLLAIVDDPAGTPVTKKATVAQLGAALISDTAYASGWNGDTTTAPSKNAIYDKLESYVIPTTLISGNWVILTDGFALGNGTSRFLDTIYLNPIIVYRRMTITDIGARIITTAAGQNIQLAIYAANTATGRPTGNALRSTGNLSTASAAVVSATLSSALTLEPGIYFAAVNCSSSTPTYTQHNYTWGYARGIGSATAATVLASGTGTFAQLTVSQTFGTWPDLTSASFTESTAERGVAMIGKIQ